MPTVGERGAPEITRNPADAYQLYINLVNSACNEIMLLLPSPANEKAEVVRSTLQALEEAAAAE